MLNINHWNLSTSSGLYEPWKHYNEHLLTLSCYTFSTKDFSLHNQGRFLIFLLFRLAVFAPFVHNIMIDYKILNKIHKTLVLRYVSNEIYWITYFVYDMRKFIYSFFTTRSPLKGRGKINYANMWFLIKYMSLLTQYQSSYRNYQVENIKNYEGNSFIGNSTTLIFVTYLRTNSSLRFCLRVSKF